MTNDKTPDRENGKWFIWVLHPGRFDIVESYINKKVSEVIDIVCPSVIKVDKRRKGKGKAKRHLIYEYYLFLQYDPASDESKVWHKLKAHPFITNYLGPCKKEELEYVLALRSSSETEPTNSNLSLGDKVEILEGKFSGLSGTVVKIDRSNIVVSAMIEPSNERVQIPVDSSEVEKV
jgi:transcription antitermination factor NusG